MAFIIMTLVGIGLSVSNANEWFVVPEFCIAICFGVAALLAVISVVNYISAKRNYNKIAKKMRF